MRGGTGRSLEPARENGSREMIAHPATLQRGAGGQNSAYRHSRGHCGYPGIGIVRPCRASGFWSLSNGKRSDATARWFPAERL
jgi:hypothetical protein